MNIKQMILNEFCNLFLLEAIDKFVNKLPTDDEEKQEIINYFNKFKDVKVNWHEKDKEKLLGQLRNIMDTHTSKTQVKKQVKKQGIKGLPDDQYIEGVPVDKYNVYIPLTHLASKMIASNKVGSQVGKWCVAENKDGYWKQYLKNKVIVLMFIHQETGIKYILGYNTENGEKEFADNTNNHKIEPPFNLGRAIKINRSKIDEAGDSLFIIDRFKEAVEKNDVETVKVLLQDKRVDPSTEDNWVIRKASRNGYLEVVKVLLQDKRVDPSAYGNYAIRYASEYGHHEVVKLLLQDQRVDPSAEDNYAIQWASENGHLEVVKLLLQDKRVDPSAEDNYAIQWASEKGHLEVVKILLQDPRVDPSADDNWAIRYASEDGHLEVVKLLLQHPKVQETLTDEQKEKYDKQIGK